MGAPWWLIVGAVDVVYSLVLCGALSRFAARHPGVVSVLQCAGAGMLGGAALGQLLVLDSAAAKSAFGAGFCLTLVANVLPEVVAAARRMHALLDVLETRGSWAECSAVAPPPEPGVLSQPLLRASDVQQLTRQRTQATLLMLWAASCAESVLTAAALARGAWRVGVLAVVTDWAQALSINAHAARLSSSRTRALALLLAWSACVPLCYALFRYALGERFHPPRSALASAIAGVYMYVALVDTLAQETFVGHNPLDRLAHGVARAPPLSAPPAQLQHYAVDACRSYYAHIALLLARPFMFTLFFACAFWL